MSTTRRLYRSRDERIIAGICGGIAEYLNADPAIIRIIFIIVSFLPGPSIIFYIIAWFIIPEAPKSPGKHDDAESKPAEIKD